MVISCTVASADLSIADVSFSAAAAAPPPPPPPATPCGTCDDKTPGKPSSVTMEWACEGAPPASVSLKKNRASYDPATGVLTVTSEKAGKKLGGDLEISYAGGQDELHMSCSAELGPGVITQSSGDDGKECQDSCSCSGCWRITTMMGENGIEYCEVCPR